ncbi:unnamed protein product [Arabidopsis halleri]
MKPSKPDKKLTGCMLLLLDNLSRKCSNTLKEIVSYPHLRFVEQWTNDSIEESVSYVKD